MVEVPGEENAPSKDTGLPEGVPTEDPFPKIFIVCFAIFVALGILIFGVIAYDLTQRVDRRVVPAQTAPEAVDPAAPESP